MNLLDLNSKILELMPFKKIKELVKNLSEKLEFKSREVDELKEEKKE